MTHTQQNMILHFMKSNPERTWFSRDFQRDPFFVGYEAPTRIGDLVRLGLVKTVGMQRPEGSTRKFMGYQLVSDILPNVTEKRLTRKQAIRHAFLGGFDSGNVNDAKHKFECLEIYEHSLDIAEKIKRGN